MPESAYTHAILRRISHIIKRKALYYSSKFIRWLRQAGVPIPLQRKQEHPKGEFLLLSLMATTLSACGGGSSKSKFTPEPPTPEPPNEPPTIDDDTFTAAEDLAASGIVGTVQASDASDTLAYSITSGNTDGLFAIDASAGMIRLASGKSLDFESAQSHVLTVQVRDTDGKTDVARITVAVTDVNEAPTIAAQTFRVAEDLAVNGIAGAVRAADPDASDTLTYSIISGNTDGLFAIDAGTGVITLASGKSLDLESARSHALIVEVRDAGGLSARARITVEVTDANEAPTIAAQTFSVAEDLAAGGNIGAVQASDRDISDTLTYRIISGNTDGLFAIDASTGVIMLASDKSLDLNSARSHQLTVEIRDTGGLTASARVTVEVLAPTNGDETANTMTGDAGVDYFKGLGGNDILDGRGGIDVLDGGADDDMLTGGADADTFVYRFDSGNGGLPTAWEGVDGNDNILDFSVSQGDQLHLIDIRVGDASIDSLAELRSAFNLDTASGGNANLITRSEGIGGKDVVDITFGAPAQGQGEVSGQHLLQLTMAETIDTSLYDGVIGQFNNFDAFITAIGGESALLFG